MARIKISALPETASLKGTDLITAVADSVNYKVQVQNLGANLTVANATNAVNATNATNAVNATNATSASYATTASYATSASYAQNGGVKSITAGAGISVNSATGDVTITNTGGGGSITFADEGSAQGTATFVDFVGSGVSVSVSSNTASVNIAGGAGSTFPYTGSAIISGSLVVIQSGSTGLTVTGSVISTDGFTGSLVGTSSWAENAVTASFVTASNVWGPYGSNSVISASNAASSSYAQSAVSIIGVVGSVMGGGGSVNYVAKFTPDGTNLGNSSITDDGSLVKVVNNTSITGSLVVSGSNGAGVFSQGATFVDYVIGISNSGSYMVWRAPFSCSVVAMYGYREGGGPAKVNAARSGSSGFGFLSGSDLSLASSNVWTAFNSVQNADFNSGDTLKLIMSGSASNSQLAVQVDFIRKF